MKITKLTLALVVMLALFAGCKKDSADKGPGTAAGDYYFKGTLNGQALNWQVTNDFDGWVTGSSAALSNDQGDISGGLTALLSATPGFTPQLGVEFRTFDSKPDGDRAADFYALVKTGSWAYAVNDDYTIGTKSLAIHYTDATGKSYTSVGLQTGSASNVITITKLAPEVGRNEGLKVKLTFNCKLYPEDGSGGTLTLANAEATVRLENLSH